MKTVTNITIPLHCTCVWRSIQNACTAWEFFLRNSNSNFSVQYFLIKHFLKKWVKYSSKIVFFHLKSNIEETSNHSLDMKNRMDTSKVLKRCAKLLSMKTRFTSEKMWCTMMTNKSAMIFVFFWQRWCSINLTIQCVTFWIMFCCPTFGPRVCTLPDSSHLNWNKTNKRSIQQTIEDKSDSWSQPLTTRLFQRDCASARGASNHRPRPNLEARVPACPPAAARSRCDAALSSGTPRLSTAPRGCPQHSASPPTLGAPRRQAAGRPTSSPCRRMPVPSCPGLESSACPPSPPG